MAMLFETLKTLKTQSHAERMVTGLRLLFPGSPIWDEADYVSYIEGQAEFDLAVFRYAMTMGALYKQPDLIVKIDCPILLLTARSMMPGANTQPGSQHLRITGERDSISALQIVDMPSHSINLVSLLRC